MFFFFKCGFQTAASYSSVGLIQEVIYFFVISSSVCVNATLIFANKLNILFLTVSSIWCVRAWVCGLARRRAANFSTGKRRSCGHWLRVRSMQLQESQVLTKNSNVEDKGEVDP